MLASAFAILALVAGTLGTLMLLTVCMASAPNSTPEQIRTIKLWMLGIAAVGFAVFVGGLWLTAAGKPWIGAVVGGAPAVATFSLLVWLSFK